MSVEIRHKNKKLRRNRAFYIFYNFVNFVGESSSFISRVKTAVAMDK
jgi:hypothetical protein